MGPGRGSKLCSFYALLNKSAVILMSYKRIEIKLPPKKATRGEVECVVGPRKTRKGWEMKQTTCWCSSSSSPHVPSSPRKNITKKKRKKSKKLKVDEGEEQEDQRRCKKIVSTTAWDSRAKEEEKTRIFSSVRFRMNVWSSRRLFGCCFSLRAQSQVAHCLSYGVKRRRFLAVSTAHSRAMESHTRALKEGSRVVTIFYLFFEYFFL